MDRRVSDKVVNVGREPKKVDRHHLILGFVTMLLVMVVVTTYTLWRISAINAELSSVVNVHNVKSELIVGLRDAMRQRQLSLRDMLILEDPFELDAAWERHTLAASKFIAVRLKLLDMAMSEDEKVAFDAMTKGATNGAILQRELVNKLAENIPREKIMDMFREALNAQDAAFGEMNRLAFYQKNAANRVAENAQTELTKTIATTLIFVIGGISIGIVVAWSVLARDKRMRSALHIYQTQLEGLVTDRTEELMNANSELESYSYSLAHDLNAPLRAITSYSQILEEDASDKLNASEIDSLNRITRAGQVMNRLIEDILKLSRITRSGFRRESVSISELAKSQATRLSSANTNREIQWDIAENILVMGDSLLLNLLLEHLFENAIRFSRNVERTKIQFGVDTIHDVPVYFVKDNGCGFDMRYSDRLFTAFQRLHSEEFTSGTGVGLAMVQRIAQRHGGKVWAESELGTGSVFYFTVPE